MTYICLPSFERERIGGKKKVNPLKDGLLILSEIVKFLKVKTKFKIYEKKSINFGVTGQDGSYLAEFLLKKIILFMELKEDHHQ